MSSRRVALLCIVVGACALPVAGQAPLRLDRQVLGPLPACRHDQLSSARDRDRRERAIHLAKAIHLAQNSAVRITRRYQPLEALANLPDRPEDFELRLYVGTAGYVFSLKDTRDPCRYGIFSDQSGFLYEKSPQSPLLANP
jgi:hypothetical protein